MRKYSRTLVCTSMSNNIVSYSEKSVIVLCINCILIVITIYNLFRLNLENLKLSPVFWKLTHTQTYLVGDLITLQRFHDSIFIWIWAWFYVLHHKSFIHYERMFSLISKNRIFCHTQWVWCNGKHLLAIVSFYSANDHNKSSKLSVRNCLQKSTRFIDVFSGWA